MLPAAPAVPALRAPSPADRTRPGAATQRLRLLALVVGVSGLHLLLADGFLAQRAGWGAGDRPPPRIDVAFVRALAAAAAPTAPAAPRPAATPARLPTLARKPRPAASAARLDDAASAAASPIVASTTASPAAASTTASPTQPPPADGVSSAAAAPPVDSAAHQASVPDPAPASAAPAPEPSVAPVTPPATSPTQAATAQAAASGAATSFNWPPSTRLTFNLSGNYRGPVDGSAEVEWLRTGSRYQVRMRTAIGPVLSRLITSDGELTDAGLAPRRFDAEQKVLFRAARRWSLRFGPALITLDDGRTLPTLPGAQDEASQFVQLTWLFTQNPERLRVGQSVELPLIIGRTLERWVYDVVGEEILQLPIGAVATFHVKPRRAAKAGELSAEIWFAPSLQTLPVRILVRQNADSWVDLTLDKPPLQAASEPTLGR